MRSRSELPPSRARMPAPTRSPASARTARRSSRNRPRTGTATRRSRAGCTQSGGTSLPRRCPWVRHSQARADAAATRSARRAGSRAARRGRRSCGCRRRAPATSRSRTRPCRPERRVGIPLLERALVRREVRRRLGDADDEHSAFDRRTRCRPRRRGRGRDRGGSGAHRRRPCVPRRTIR